MLQTRPNMKNTRGPAERAGLQTRSSPTKARRGASGAGKAGEEALSVARVAVGFFALKLKVCDGVRSAAAWFSAEFASSWRYPGVAHSPAAQRPFGP